MKLCTYRLSSVYHLSAGLAAKTYLPTYLGAYPSIELQGPAGETPRRA